MLLRAIGVDQVFIDNRIIAEQVKEIFPRGVDKVPSSLDNDAEGLAPMHETARNHVHDPHDGQLVVVREVQSDGGYPHGRESYDLRWRSRRFHADAASGRDALDKSKPRPREPPTRSDEPSKLATWSSCASWRLLSAGAHVIRPRDWVGSMQAVHSGFAGLQNLWLSSSELICASAVSQSFSSCPGSKFRRSAR
jgi:hypothetical protein